MVITSTGDPTLKQKGKAVDKCTGLSSNGVFQAGSIPGWRWHFRGGPLWQHNSTYAGVTLKAGSSKVVLLLANGMGLCGLEVSQLTSHTTVKRLRYNAMSDQQRHEPASEQPSKQIVVSHISNRLKCSCSTECLMTT